MPSDEDCANPMLVKIMKEWWDKARDRNSKGQLSYKKAYDALKGCPLKFDHASEATMLSGIGPTFAKKLAEAVEDHCRKNNLPIPKKPRKKRKLNLGEDGDTGESASPSPKKKRKPKPYVPALRSGPYAIMLALSTLDEDHAGIDKQRVIALAQQHCDSSFTVPQDAGKFYTAWNSIGTLKDKDLVSEKGRPTKKYALTDDGWEVVNRIKKASDPSQGRLDTFVGAQRATTDNDDDSPDVAGSPIPASAPGLPIEPSMDSATADLIPQGSVVANPNALPTFSPIVLEPGSFTVELVLDNREIFGKNDRDYMEKNLTAKGVIPSVRALKLGDVLWVAKMHDPGLLNRRGLEGDEIMLDYVVERKRLDDLVSSIKDGRFHEQKFRLRKSGIKNAIYIVEEVTTRSDSITNMAEAITTAIASSQVIDGYFVKRTLKMDDTIRYLVGMTKLLKQKYESKSLHVIPTSVVTVNNYNPLLAHLEKKEPAIDYHLTYDAFACLGSKSETLTLRDIFLKMLMCTRGLTGEKAIELQKKWKTPIELIEAYRKIEDVHGSGEVGKNRKWDMVSKAMDHPVPRKKIAKALSTKIAETWGDASTAMA
ncbi:uncharacterized protein LY89DRAFT_691372 [Mollisia scopiformis]|uniref:Crossover junction endonuclease MUS81 n=1 Tax=Mollisia scopiformis TaxID=149040 RepID=A0A132B6S0_MOLSC|nr:uncharacterized protein LY89DRAFT_691372 [Mollisia scopiformis]KUJ08100.1 hypothetical protein LY89DRAFT_691372 [Mollisia scopiformis]